MNRVLVSQGVLTNGIVQIASNQGVYLQYNLAGERSSASQYDGQVLTFQGSTLTYTSGLEKSPITTTGSETWCRLTGRSLVSRGHYARGGRVRRQSVPVLTDESYTYTAPAA